MADYLHMECPRCGDPDAYIEPIDPEDFMPGSYVHQGERRGSCECSCWPDRFTVVYDTCYDRLVVLGPAGEEQRAREAEAHPDERVVGSGEEGW